MEREQDRDRDRDRDRDKQRGRERKRERGREGKKETETAEGQRATQASRVNLGIVPPLSSPGPHMARAPFDTRGAKRAALAAVVEHRSSRPRAFQAEYLANRIALAPLQSFRPSSSMDQWSITIRPCLNGCIDRRAPPPPPLSSSFIL